MDLDAYIRERWIKALIVFFHQYDVSRRSLALSMACVYATFILGECAYNAMIGNHSIATAIVSLIAILTSTYIYHRTLEFSDNSLHSLHIQISEYPFRMLVFTLLAMTFSLNIISLLVLDNFSIGAADLGIAAVYINMQLLAFRHPPAAPTETLN